MEAGPNDEQLQKLVALADGLKLAGNQALKAGSLVEAEKLYAQGIEALVATKGFALTILSQLYSNRAAVRVTRNAFAEAVDDCRKSIIAHRTNLKAYWRGAKASLSMDLYQQALDFARDGLSVDADHVELRSLAEIASSKLLSRRGNRGISEEEAINAQKVAKQLTDQLYVISQKARSLEFDVARNEHTLELLREIPNNTPCYRGLGRGFIHAEKSALINGLESRNFDIKSKQLPEVSVSANLVKTRLETAEKELRELIQ